MATAMNMAIIMVAKRVESADMIRALAQSQPARSPREWAVRGSLAALALVLGYVSTTEALGYTLLRTNSERAYALSPGDGRIAGLVALRIASNSDASRADRHRADTLARQALVAEPLAVTAMTALGIDMQIAGNTTTARRLFVHSDAVSRREFGTRLWLIEDAVARGDVSGALHHYDIALRTEKSAADLLFPILSNAIRDPAVAGALADTMAAKPAWASSFLLNLPTSGATPQTTASFFRQLMYRGIHIPPQAQAGAVTALFASGAFDEAWALYKIIQPGVVRTASRNSDFRKQPEAASPFDWKITPDSSEMTASILNSAEGGVLDFSAPATIGGTIAEQAQVLPPGRYRLAGTARGLSGNAASVPYWQVTCVNGQELGRVLIIVGADGKSTFEGRIEVPSTCRAQILRLVIRPDADGVMGQITRAGLTSIGTTR